MTHCLRINVYYAIFFVTVAFNYRHGPKMRLDTGRKKIYHSSSGQWAIAKALNRDARAVRKFTKNSQKIRTN